MSNFSEALQSEQGSLQLSSFPTSASSVFPTSKSSPALPPFHQLKAQLQPLPPSSSGPLSPESQPFNWPSPEFAPHLGSAKAEAPHNPFDGQSTPRNPFDAPQPHLQPATEAFSGWDADLPQGVQEDFDDFGGQANVMDFLAQEEEA